MAKKSGVKTMASAKGGQDVIILSTGVVLKLQTVPAWKMNDATNEIKKPDVPKMIVDGDRVTENPDDPEYQKALKKYTSDMSDKVNDYMIVFGTSLVSKPEGFPGPEEMEWREKLEWSGMKLGENKIAIYCAWVKYVAGPLINDIKLILAEVGRRSGVSEADVKTAADNFRSGDKRDTDNTVQP